MVKFKPLFNTMDRNGDGRLSRQELRNTEGLNKKQKKAARHLNQDFMSTPRNGGYGKKEARQSVNRYNKIQESRKKQSPPNNNSGEGPSISRVPQPDRLNITA